jgi:DNA-binding transcriptional MerR regulator
MSTVEPREGYSVGRVADLASVSVRTLHHYDEIGLVRPHDRSPAGYRLNSAEDIERLQQLLIYRRLVLTPEEQLEIFGTDKVGGEWAEEAEQRWGDSDTYRESQRRTATYGKEDWARLKEESDAGLRAFADTLRSGEPADGDRARALAEEHRRFLSKWFYDCSYEMHRNLALMYVDDERFRANFESVLPGLANYVSEAIITNADRPPVTSREGEKKQ